MFHVFFSWYGFLLYLGKICNCLRAIFQTINISFKKQEKRIMLFLLKVHLCISCVHGRGGIEGVSTPSRRLKKLNGVVTGEGDFYKNQGIFSDFPYKVPKIALRHFSSAGTFGFVSVETWLSLQLGKMCMFTRCSPNVLKLLFDVMEGFEIFRVEKLKTAFYEFYKKSFVLLQNLRDIWLKSCHVS